MYHSFEAISLGASLDLRVGLVRQFFSEMTVLGILFPYFSDFRPTVASLHNEMLEIWFRCGLVALLVYVFWGYQNISQIYSHDRFLGALLLFIFMAGGIIQLNFLHFYTMVLLSAVIGYYRAQGEKCAA
jgi:hypothetical protein